MEGLLTPVSTSYKPSRGIEEDLLKEVQKSPEPSWKPSHPASTPEEALEILRNGPDFDNLRRTLRFLKKDAPTSSNFSLTTPSPLSSQLINALVSDIIPNYWGLLNKKDEVIRGEFEHNAERNLLLSSLRSVTGLSALLVRLKALIQQFKETSKNDERLRLVNQMKAYLEVTETTLSSDAIVETLWKSLQSQPPPRQRALWSEVVSLIGGGRLLNTSAESLSIVKEESKDVMESTWISDGLEYSRWLSRNIKSWSLNLSLDVDVAWKSLSDMLSKSLRLGQSDAVLEIIFDMLLGSEEDRKHFGKLLDSMPAFEQRSFVNGALHWLSKRHLREASEIESPDWWKSELDIVSAAACCLKKIIGEDENRNESLMNWLTALPGAGIGEGVNIRRAAIAALSQSRFDLESVMEKSFQQFSDQLYIKHAPTLQQDVHTQVLLLTVGYVHRLAPIKVSMLIRSSLYLNAVSNRLSATSNRARFLGMVVGEAISGLMEKQDKRLDLKVPEMQSAEAKWYKSLVTVQDRIGSLDPLLKGPKPKVKTKAKPHPVIKPSSASANQKSSKIIAIEEIEEDSSEDDDLVPYAKPDSDEEDSEEDATLIQRNKPTAPVYIRDLITYFRDTDNYDRQKLALTIAPSLIRRKADFGTEVTAHAEELATLLVGLQDKYDIDNFQDLRIQGMIAVLLSEPPKMAKWFSKTFFDGDYSISQRASVLTVLSVSARELGGYAEEDKSLTTVSHPPADAFPSKRLPGRLHKTWSALEQKQNNDNKQIEALSQSLSRAMIQPLAASAADQMTGPNILKVRTFSSRMDVEAKRPPPKANALAAIVADSYFFPLIGRFSAAMKAYGMRNVLFDSFLLSSFVKTLSIILHAAGSSTLQLPQMTSEFWDLLLGLRAQTVGDHAVAEAVLFGFMTLLEVNQDKRTLSETQGRNLIETQKWVEVFFQSVSDGNKEDERVRMLAAGIMFRIREVVEKYQALLMGDLSSF